MAATVVFAVVTLAVAKLLSVQHNSWKFLRCSTAATTWLELGHDQLLLPAASNW